MGLDCMMFVDYAKVCGERAGAVRIAQEHLSHIQA